MTLWRGPLARIGTWTPYGRDLAAAGALAVLSVCRTPWVIEIYDGAVSATTLVAAQALVMVDLATVALRRRLPLAALALATLVPLVATLMPIRLVFVGVGLPVCAYTVARLLPRDIALVAVLAATVVHGLGGIAAVSAGGDTAGVTTFWGVPPGDRTDLLIATAASVLLPALLGSYVQTREAYTREVNARLARLAREREEKARVAVRDERGRIAGELHDIAAHDLSAIVVQAGAADRLVERDPEAVRELLQRIRAQGRDTLASLRGLVGIVRERAAQDGDTAGGGRSPQPTLARLVQLVEHARGTGMQVDLTVDGTPLAVAPAVDLAAYRVVQESLANARQHAPGAPVDVVVTYGPQSLHVVVGNPYPDGDARGSGRRGHGLLVMRERVARAGGDVSAGGSGEGRWLVSAELPTQGVRP